MRPCSVRTRTAYLVAQLPNTSVREAINLPCRKSSLVKYHALRIAAGRRKSCPVLRYRHCSSSNPLLTAARSYLKHGDFCFSRVWKSKLTKNLPSESALRKEVYWRIMIPVPIYWRVCQTSVRNGLFRCVALHCYTLPRQVKKPHMLVQYRTWFTIQCFSDDDI